LLPAREHGLKIKKCSYNYTGYSIILHCILLYFDIII
jgi:hypothetical protein